MAVLTVGTGEEYATIAAAVAASSSGDTIAVDAGTYTNDFTNIDHSLTLQAVGGMVTMAATVQPPDGKAILTEGAPGIAVSIDGFAFTGATVPDANGAGIRYQGGSLTITNSLFHDNQNGILGGADPNGVISISNSEFDHNGVGGVGQTHNIYIGDIQSFTLTNSFSHDAVVGHEVKSRAENNTITNNRILDNTGSASYEIDLPNGGNATISGNVIQQGANSQNPTIISYGEEGNLHAGTSLSVTGNTILNDLGRGAALVNASAATTATFSNNSVYGFGANPLVSGNATESGTVVLGSEPTLDESAPSSSNAAMPSASYTDVTANFASQADMSAAPQGSPSYLDWQYIWSSPDSVAIAATTPNVFLKGGAGSDALQVTSGQNVIDGGTGSNFLVGGSGTDTFFTDGTGTADVWNTLVNFHAGDAATLWGFDAAASTYAWDASVSGADGYTGATLRASIGSGGTRTEASITFAGLSVEQGNALTISTGTTGGLTYLYIAPPTG